MSDINKEKKRSIVTLNQVVAEKLDVSPSYVGMVARGERNHPAINNEIEKLNDLIEDFKAEGQNA